MKARLTPDRKIVFESWQGSEVYAEKTCAHFTYRLLKDLLCEAGVVASGQSVFVVGDLNVRFEQCLP